MTGNDALDAMQALDELRKAAVAFTIQAAIEVGAHPQTMQSLQERLLAYVNEPNALGMPLTHDMWCVTADLMAAGHVNPFVEERRRAHEAVVESVAKMTKLGIKLTVPPAVSWMYGNAPECEEEP